MHNLQPLACSASIVPLVKNLLRWNSMVPTLPRSELLPCSSAYAVSYSPFLLSASLVIIHSYQTMSIASVEIRKSTYEGGTQKTWNLFIKNWLFILTSLNFSHLQSIPHWMQYTYGDVFPPAQNSFRTHRLWCLLALLPFFCFTSSTWAKYLPLRTIFIQGDKKCLSGWDEMNRENRAWGSCHFWSKTAEHSVWCEQVQL